MSTRRLALLIVALLLGHSLVLAQVPSSRRWEVTGAFGASTGGPSRAIELAMIAGGLNDPHDNGCCTPPAFFPETWGGGNLRGTLAVSYAVRPWWMLRLQTTTTDFGATKGYHDPFSGPSGWLELEQSVTSVSALTLFGMGGLRVGAGPSLHRVAVSSIDDNTGRVSQNSHTTRLGLALHAGVSFPARTLFFAHASAQYQMVGDVDVGPYTADDSVTTMPRTRASFSYRRINVGVGLRL
jgi:hypothetical protein